MALAPFNKQTSLFSSPFENDWQIFDPFRDQFFNNQMMLGNNNPARQVAPLLAADLVETENEFKVFADLPGVDPSQLELTIDQHSLVMKAERKHSHEKNTDKVHTLERSYGSVQRRIRLPKNADVDKAVSNFDNGVLTVTFPKLADQPQTWRRLEVNSGSSNQNSRIGDGSRGSGSGMA